MIKLLIFLASISVPSLFVYLNISHTNVLGKYYFTVFFLAAMIERLWGTFFTQKGDATRKFHGDWTLVATTFSYFIVSLLMGYWFFLSDVKNLLSVFLGIVIFATGLLLRYYSVSLLGKQWNIHISDSYRTDQGRRLVREGTYKFMRHPIYFCAILELLGLALISNAYVLIWLVIFWNTPLFIWRSIHEERQSLKIFGAEYEKYKKEVPLMIPWKLFN